MEPGTGMGSMGSNIYYAKMFALVGDRDRDQAVPFPVPPLVPVPYNANNS